MMEDETVAQVDDWWQACGFIDGFNQRRVEVFNTSIIYVLDESMSAMIPR